MGTGIYWLAALIAFCVLEAVTAGLTSIWFAIGTLGALAANGLGLSIWVQIGVFLALSGLSMLLIRPLAQKLLIPGFSPTNADRIIGKTAMVTEEIDNILGSGLVSISGQVWTARSQNDTIIPAGKQVRVLRIEGVKVYVEIFQERKEL